MPKGKIYVPLDLRGMTDRKLPFTFEVDEEGDKPCVRVGLFTDAVHVDLRADSSLIERFILELVGTNRDLREKIAFQKGALHATRKKKK